MTITRGESELPASAKAILLCGGHGTRLAPMTHTCNKQLLPVYDKPLLYYPLALLMGAGFREILIVTQSENIPYFRRAVRDGEQWGVTLRYTAQDVPLGLADAFPRADSCGFLDGAASVCLLLGDNIFYGCRMADRLRNAALLCRPVIYAAHVPDPARYGVLEFADKTGAVCRVVEKPAVPPSPYAVIGVYVYPPDVVEIVKGLTPSARNQLEIVDVHNAYLTRDQLHVDYLPRTTVWMDAGTPEALLEAATFIHTTQHRCGVLIGSPELAALQNGWITHEQALDLAEEMSPGGYGNSLRAILRDLHAGWADQHEVAQ